MKKTKPTDKGETIFETEHRLKQEAKQLAEIHKNRKVTKFLLK